MLGWLDYELLRRRGSFLKLSEKLSEKLNGELGRLYRSSLS